MSHFRKRLGIRGALLLSGLQLSTMVCQAQAAPAVAAPAAGLPADAQQMIARRQAIEEQWKKCALPIDIDVNGATLKQLVDQLQLAAPDTSIALRLSAEDKAAQRLVDDDKVKLEETKLPTFRIALEQKPLGDVLQSAATLAGYNFYILPDELLLSQPKELAPGEGDRAVSWSSFANRFASQTLAKQWSEAERQMVLTNKENLAVIGRELLALARKQGMTEGPFTVQFSDFSPEIQQKIQTSADYVSRPSNRPMGEVPADASVELTDFGPADVRFTLRIKSKDITKELNRAYDFGADVSSGGKDTAGTRYRFLPSVQSSP